MAKNQAILDMLSALTIEGKSEAEQKRILDALDALVSGELDDVSSFRSQLIKNRTVFFPGPTSVISGSPQNDDDFLSSAGDGERNNLGVLIHKAVEKRIVLGLEGCNCKQLKAIVDVKGYKEHRFIIKDNPGLYGKRYEKEYFDSADVALDAMADRAEERLYVIELGETKKIEDLFLSCFLKRNEMQVDPALDLSQNKKKLEAINEQLVLVNRALLDASEVVIDSASFKKHFEKQLQIIKSFTIESQFLYNHQLINEKIAAIRVILESVKGASELESKKQLNQMELLLRETNVALNHIQKIDITVITRAETLASINQQLSDNQAAINKVESEVVLLKALLYPLPAPLDHGNIYSSSSDFTDEIVKTGEKSKILHAHRISGEAKYTKFKLDPHEELHSTIQFPAKGQGPGHQEQASGRLIQDHTGKVTNDSTPNLSAPEKLKVAFQQAEMILNNYQPGSGSITIRGSAKYRDEAQYLLVALIKLQTEKYPALMNVNIVSRVAGCNVPNGGDGLLSGAINTLRGGRLAECIRDNNIPKELIPGINDLGKKLAGKLEALDEMKAARQNDFKEKYAKMCEPGKTPEEKREIAKSMRDASLNEGDDIDLKGHVTKNPRV